MALALCHQVQPMCDELVVTEDAPGDFTALRIISDIYSQHKRLGDLRNTQLGIDMATSEYVAVLNSDITIDQGNLRDLCVPSRIVCPRGAPPVDEAFAGYFFVAPRELLARYPLPSQMDEQAIVRGWGRYYGELIKEVYLWYPVLDYTHHWNQSYHHWHSILNMEK